MYWDRYVIVVVMFIVIDFQTNRVKKWKPHNHKSLHIDQLEN
jgi:phage-related holin